MPITWEELGAAALARQFPADPPTDVADAVRRFGPIQSQTARSPFLGLAARMPGVTHSEVTAAYEAHAIVRGSTIRGTVHTTVPEHHALMEVATRLKRRGDVRRTLGVDDEAVDELWADLETYARDEWREPAELHAWLISWSASHGGASAEQMQEPFARYLALGHGGLVRRPLSGGWEGQGAPGYRTASAMLGDRDEVLTSPTAFDDLLRAHLSAHGPASRRDLSWWSNLNLRDVDAALGRLDLDTVTGPDGEEYADLPSAPPARSPEGVRLLPEFDALLCAYAPSARLRFLTAEHHARLWNQTNNGLVLPPLLVDGRITGYWRATGSARSRPLVVVWFAGTRRPRRAELEGPVAALESALGITITSVTIAREVG